MKKSGGNDQMYMYEMILDIVEKNGPMTISSICQEMNKLYTNQNDSEKIIKLSYVKSAISKKKDIFKVVDNVVSIDPEKTVHFLTVHLGGAIEPAITIKVDFIGNRFFLFEWHFDLITSASMGGKQLVRVCGDVATFKKELYRIKPWEWEEDYHPDGMVLDGIFWTVKLVSEGKVYESEGLNCFPKDWEKLCKGLTKLTGLNLKKQLSV